MSRFYNLDQVPFNSRELSKAIVAAIAGQYNGAYFDAQDMSTMFQDVAGTTPVTAMERPVGKWLDKSGNGNHATQSVTASRPVVSARYNLLTKSERFSESPWIRENMTTVDNAAGSPIGDNSAAIITSTASPSYTRLPETIVNNQKTTFKINVKDSSTGWVRVVVANNSGNSAAGVFVNTATGAVGSNAIVGSGYNLVFATAKKAEDGWVGVLIVIDAPIERKQPVITLASADNNINVSIGSSVKVWGADLRNGDIRDFKYQRVNTATDYDTAGFKKYLKFDGVDDYLNLPYLGLYANGSASIVAARDALSQATDTYVISERSTANVNPKYFPSRQLANAGNMDAYIVNDAAAVVVDTVGSVYGGASDAVIRSAIDSGNNIKLFKNGALAANDNYTRSGTLTLTNTTIGASVSTTTSNYANMKLYGLCIAKSALSDSERRRVERLLAYNSGVQI